MKSNLMNDPSRGLELIRCRAPFRIKAEQGFTLLELVVVIALLGLFASLATDFSLEKSSQLYQEVSIERAKTIRKVIGGDPNLTANNSPVIQGFVADTGQLPQHLIALMLPQYCSDPRFLNDASACVSGGGVWQSLSNWHGPYIRDYAFVEGTFDNGTSSDESDDIIVRYPAYRDGWSNRAHSWLVGASNDQKLAYDILNSGWYFGVNSNNIILKSVGLDRTLDPGLSISDFDAPDLGTTGTASNEQRGEYLNQNDSERDYPLNQYLQGSSSTDWNISLPHLLTNTDYLGSSVSVAIDYQITGGADACLMITNSGGGVEQIIDGDVALAAAGSQGISGNDTITAILGDDVPHGRYRLSAYRENATPAAGAGPCDDTSGESLNIVSGSIDFLVLGGHMETINLSVNINAPLATP